MEETALHARALQQAHRAGIAIRQDGFCAVVTGDGRQAMRDGIQRFIPTDALKPSFAFSADPFLRIEQAVGRILAVQVPGHFAAQEAAGYGMIRVAAEMAALPLFHVDEQGTAVRTVESANGVTNVGHIQNYSWSQAVQG